MKKVKKTAVEPEKPIQIERIVLVAYLIHTLSLSAVLFRAGLLALAVLPLLIGTPIVLYMHLRRTRSYEFRARFTAVLLWINISLYAVFTDDFLGMLTSVGALVMLLALYELPHIFIIGNIFYTAIILFHLLWLRDISLDLSHDGMLTVTRVFSVYLISLFAYYFVKTELESRRHLMENIEELHRVEHSKDDFLSNVSHEIRTPVNTICGMSEIVLHGDIPTEARGYVYDIQTAGRNLLSIVSDILDFSELESGKISILRDSYSIASVVNDIVGITNAKNSDKQLEFIVDCDPSMPQTLVGDRQKICRAVINVIDNAIKFTREGGFVLTVSTRREEYGANLCVAVEDTGIGIQPEILEKIFTNFNQANTAGNRAESGIGLGLAISKTMVNKMGGFLKIDSVYGRGTRVNIVIPQGIEDPSPCITVKDAHEKRILVYLHLEENKFPLLREANKTAIRHMVTCFDGTAFACRNLTDVKRRIENEEITHLFIGWEEYQEAPSYFDEVADKLQVTLILERSLPRELPDGNIFCIGAPLYSLAVASILNGEAVRDMHIHTHRHRFIAPDVHILVVDDNLMNLRVVEGLLRPYKLKVSVAQSGREALQKLSAKDFDFVFMDHMMPEMDGIETLRRIREKQDSYYRSVPVIALTANAVGNAREMFLSEGFAEYLSKPIEMSALEHILRKFIPRGKMVYAERELTASETNKGTGNTEKSSGSASTVSDRLTNEGIDVSLGVTYCGGEMSAYLEILSVYLADGDKNIARVREACERGDVKSYVILTHTLKSTSKSIGAVSLSEKARELEEKARDSGDISLKLTEEMLTEYARVLDVIKRETDTKTKEPSESTPPGAAELTAEQFVSCKSELAQRLDSFDADSVNSYIEGLEGKTYKNVPLSELLKPIRALIDNFDFMGASDELDKIDTDK